ncbi:hypothetical protein ACIF8T_40355 [Streptomyces sp. NPDC085946]|uniref:hypothetical protein n=1 Tax=Streptomyces sp. NPDC085946 TaxID=3365744 RepID=UPI0037D1565E
MNQFPKRMFSPGLAIATQRKARKDRKGKVLLRTSGMAAAILTLATSGVIMTASSAQARPIDCSLSITIERHTSELGARAWVNCPKPEHYTVNVYLYRDEWYGNDLVAQGKRDSNGAGGALSAYAAEPCSDLQTNKKYYARAVLYDTTYSYPIEVKDTQSGSYWGHC